MPASFLPEVSQAFLGCHEMLHGLIPMRLELPGQGISAQGFMPVFPCETPRRTESPARAGSAQQWTCCSPDFWVPSSAGISPTEWVLSTVGAREGHKARGVKAFSFLSSHPPPMQGAPRYINLHHWTPHFLYPDGCCHYLMSPGLSFSIIREKPDNAI